MKVDKTLFLLVILLYKCPYMVLQSGGSDETRRRPVLFKAHLCFPAIWPLSWRGKCSEEEAKRDEISRTILESINTL